METDRGLETDRDLETYAYMDLEHFVEPQNHAINRPSHHTSDRAPPKIHMVPTNRAKSNREEAIQLAFEWRDQENMPFDDLALEFAIPKITLYNRSEGRHLGRRPMKNTKC